MSARPAWPGGGRVRVAGFLRGRRSSPWREIGPGPTFGAVPQTDKQRGVTGGEGSGRPSWPLEAPGWAAPGVRRKSSERPGPQGRGAGRRQPDLAGEPVRRLPLALGWGEAARGRSSGRVLWGAAGGLVWTRRRKNPVPDAQGSPPARKGLSVEWAEPVWCLGCPDWRLRVPRVVWPRWGLGGQGGGQSSPPTASLAQGSWPSCGRTQTPRSPGRAGVGASPFGWSWAAILRGVLGGLSRGFSVTGALA